MQHIYFYPVIFISFYLVGLTLVWSLYRRKEDYNILMRLYSVAYVFQSLLTLGIFILLYSQFGTHMLELADTGRFYRKAEILVQQNFKLNSVNIGKGSEGIVYLYGIIFTVFGEGKFILSCIWVLGASVSIIPTYYLSKKIFGRRVAYLSSVLLGVYPSVASLSALPHKDVLSMLFFISALGSFVWYNERPSVYRLAISLVPIACLVLIRVEMSIVLISALVIYALWGLLSKGEKIKYISIYLSVLVVITLIFTSWLIPNTLSEIKYVLYPSMFYERVKDVMRLTRIRGNSAGFVDTIRHMGPLGRMTAGSLVMFIKPFPPTKVLQNLDLAALVWPGTVFIYFLSPYFLIGMYRGIVNREEYVILILSAFLAITLASGLFYAGAQVRYRLQILPLYIIIASYGVFFRKRHLKFVFLYWYLFISLVVLYEVAKVS